MFTAADSGLYSGGDTKPEPLFSNKRASLFSDNNDSDFGGYDPSSFGGPNKQSGPRAKPVAAKDNTWKESAAGGKRASGIGDLFGSDPKPKAQPSIFDNDDDIFGSSPKASVPNRKTSLPWESDSKPAVADKMLPRRPRADHTTIHNKPTVRAIDDFDDDLEEVML